MRIGLALAAFALTGCLTAPVRVSSVAPTVVQREFASTVLNGDTPSKISRQVLQRQGLWQKWEDEPVAALAELHATLPPTGGRYTLFALSELAYAYAQDSGDRSYYLASAVYAYTLLFPGDGASQPLHPSDPRLRVACDLYNRALAEALHSRETGEVELASGLRILPFGSLDVALEQDGLLWAGYELESFVPAADLEVHGLRNRYRRAGIGAPLVASLARSQTRKLEGADRRIPKRMQVPVTALLRLEAPRAALARGNLRGALEVHSQDEALDVEIDGATWPLEFETTSALASMLQSSRWWEFEFAGFFSSAIKVSATQRGANDGLLLLHPYRPGRIPVVLVHGTASSPARWAELVNELEIDAEIWSRYQIWLYIYNTGNPIGFSGGGLRRALEHAVAELDPLGKDPALQQMVVIGHSQGGLLTKLTAVDAGDRFWKLTSDEAIENLRMPPDTRQVLIRSTFFTPQPFVKRVVFLCTPHRGSYLASLSLSRWVASFVALPSDLTGRMLEVVTLNEGALALRSLDKLPTSIDNMAPGNDFIETLSALPVAPGIRAHSIIAANGDGPVENSVDGVVSYQSAHLDGVESELVVRSGHSAQANPAVIEEVRRILLLHLLETPGLTPPE
jgi:pimeloyl-ACP methyl ester carboxylesterase